MLRIVLSLTLVAGFVSSSTSSQGQVPGPAQDGQPGQSVQQAFTIEQAITRHSYNSDGTGTQTQELRVRLLSQAGVQELGQLAFGYNSDSEQLTIDYVRVHKPSGQIVDTPTANAPEASLQISKDAPTYTDYREKHISVAALLPGDILEYKVTTKLLHPVAPNQFWLTYSFNKLADVRDERLIVEVPKDRTIKIKSLQPYSTENNSNLRVYSWKSSNTPKDNPAAGSGKDGAKDQETVPDVELSSFQSWQEVAAWYDGLQRDRVSATPELKAKALELIKGAATDEARAQRIYDFVSKNIRYVSLSFGIGRYQPHVAADVFHNEYGDCKDKHTLLATLLQVAGINSHAVLIHSQNALDPDVPAPSQFDHVITAAEIAGKRVWLDSTIGVAPFGLILPVMRGKQALLVAPDLIGPLVRVPDVSPVMSEERDSIEGQFDEAGNLEADFKNSLLGDQALVMRLAARQLPQAQWQEFVQRMSYAAGFAGDVSKVNFENVESPELPLLMSYHYSRRSYFQAEGSNRTGRNTLPLFRVGVDAEDVAHMKQDQSLRIGGPVRLTQKATLKFAKGQQPKIPIAVSISRDYGKYTSKYDMDGETLKAERLYEINVATLPSSREKDLQSFLSAINQDAAQQVAINIAPGALPGGLDKSTDAGKLNDAARARLDVKDFAAAEQFARRATEADPQSPYAWNNLGLAYMGEGNKLEEAKQAFRKQIEVNPYDGYAYNNLGRALEQQDHSDEAIAAYRKQIEIVPLDRWTHANLGTLLAKLKKYNEAIPELETASQITPEDTRLKFLLADAYLHTEQKEKAQQLLSALSVSVPSGSGGIDIYSTVIRDDADPDAAFRDARDGLQKFERSFPLSSEGDQGSMSATVVPALWAAAGWAYFRMGQLENAERYLNAAWITSQSAVVGLKLAQVYEKQNKKTLAMKICAEASSGEGTRQDKESARAHLVRLVGNPMKADEMTAAARQSLTTSRTVSLHKTPVKALSATILLTFAQGPMPEKVKFSDGAPSLVDRYENAIKAHRFPVLYPDDVAQHLVRQAILYCGAAGCSVVLVPPSPLYGPAKAALPQ